MSAFHPLQTLSSRPRLAPRQCLLWVENGRSRRSLERPLLAISRYRQPSASTCVYKREGVPQFDNQGLTYALRRFVTTPVTASSGI